MMRSLKSLLLIGSLASVAAACGGGPSGPTRLSHTLDNQYIVAVPPSEQQGVIYAEQELTVATKERDKAQFDLEGIKVDEQIAKWELERAKLSMKIAQARRESSARAGIAMQNLAEAEMRNAMLGLSAAEAKHEFVKAKKKWLEKWRRATEYGYYAADAKLQLEKARVAQAKNNYPKGFDLSKFESQARDRGSAAKSHRDSAESDLRRAEERRQEWARREQDYAASMGMKTMNPEATTPLNTPVQPPQPQPQPQPQPPPTTTTVTSEPIGTP